MKHKTGLKTMQCIRNREELQCDSYISDSMRCLIILYQRISEWEEEMRLKNYTKANKGNEFNL